MTETQTFAMLSDQPALEDQLNFEPYVATLKSIVTGPRADTPLVVGVFGGWGSGKTSLLRMLKQQLSVTPHFRAVWFNAWKYDQEDALWRAFLLRVLDALYPRKEPPTGAKELPWEQRERYAPDDLIDEQQQAQVRLLERLQRSLYQTVEWEDLGRWAVNWRGAGKELAELPAYLLLLSAGAEKVAEKLGLQPDLAQLLQRETQQHRLNQLASMEQFEETFREALRQCLGPEGRLVVFVDDLDRCLAEQALSVLEAIKLFLDVEGCVFVLGLDPEAIRCAVQTRYADGKDPQAWQKADEYLEKIIQIPFRLPPIPKVRMQEYVGKVAKQGLPGDRCERVFGVGVAANPRRVKRALNVFLLLWNLAQKQPELGDRITPLRLAKIVVIQQYYPELWALLLDKGAHYLSDLERLFRAGERSRETGALPETGDDAPAGPQNPKSKIENPDSSAGLLQKFLGLSLLRDLLTCTAETEADANFVGLKTLEIQEYIYLTRSAVAEPAAPSAAPVPQTPLPFEPQLVTIPAGPFLMGTPEREVAELAQLGGLKPENVQWEVPQHQVTLDTYAIARYPITNAEFGRFIEDGGYTVRAYWTDVGWKQKEKENWIEPRLWKDDKWNDPAQPVVGVSWYEAVAYCRWLTAKSDGRYTYRLPTEAEWEKAARGTDGRRYPWGNPWDASRCNSKESGLGKTTPVGQYPEGDSPYGVSEMVGQVWEWCSTKWGHKYTDPPNPAQEDLEGEEARILRGGSWYNDNPAGICRCGFRDGSVSWGRNIILWGFRCVRTSSS